MSNIEKFNEAVGLVLGKLYAEFPIPLDLDVTELIESQPKSEAAPFTVTIGGAGVMANLPDLNAEQTLMHYCIDWLAQSGFIRTESTWEGYFNKAVLTIKGLEVLKSYPDSLTTGPSIGDQLASASKGGATELLRSAANEAMGLGARFFAQALGLPT